MNKVQQYSPVKSSGPEHFFVGRFLIITDSISLLIIGLFRFSVFPDSFWIGFKFLGIYPFLIDCSICQHTIVIAVSYNPLYFRGIIINVCSFISPCLTNIAHFLFLIFLILLEIVKHRQPELAGLGNNAALFFLTNVPSLFIT